MDNQGKIKLKCQSELELDLIMELMSEYHLTPIHMQKFSQDGIEIRLELDDEMDKSSFFSKLMIYDIYYSILPS